MPAFISRKTNFLIFLGGLCIAVAAIFLLNHLLAGPKLGPHYDFLLSRRSPPVAREILLINTGEIVESSELFTALMTLSEFGASDLLLGARVVGSALPAAMSEWEMHRQFNEEFELLSSNIRNLFEAIRLGFLSPLAAPLYVERLVELAEQGRNRLTSMFFEYDESLVNAALIFGSFLDMADPRFLPQPGRDNLRRAAPFDAETEHPVFYSLKFRWAGFEVESYADGIGRGPVLVIHHRDGEKLRLSMDAGGNILFDNPGIQFRRLDIEKIIEYEEIDRRMRQLLTEAESLMAFSLTVPHRIPLFLFDHAIQLREDLLQSPDPQKKAAWRAARADYFESLEDFLHGGTEELLKEKLMEEVLPLDGLEETAGESQNQETQETIDNLLRAFAAMRETQLELTRLRDNLREYLAFSYCIMGPIDGQSHVKAAALFANVLLTGSHIKSVENLYILLLSFGAVFIILFGLHAIRPAIFLPAGLIAIILCGFGFGLLFVFSAYWIDPLIACGACATGVIFIFCAKTGVIRHRARRFCAAYGPAVSKPVLQELIRASKPLLSEIIVKKAAVIAVTDSSFYNTEESDLVQAAKIRAAFYAKVWELFTNAGAVIAGNNGDTVFVCFGSPLERIYLQNTQDTRSLHPAAKACEIVTKLLKDGQIQWHFGIDYGDCVFSWSPQTGYVAGGSPVNHASILLTMARRARISGGARALISEPVLKKLGRPAEKIGSTGVDEHSQKNVYRMV